MTTRYCIYDLVWWLNQARSRTYLIYWSTHLNSSNAEESLALQKAGYCAFFTFLGQVTPLTWRRCGQLILRRSRQSLGTLTCKKLHVATCLHVTLIHCSWTTADRTPCGFVCFLDPVIILVMRMGWGCGGVGIIPNVSRATLHDLHLHLAAWSSLALDATLRDLRLHFDRWGWGGVGIIPNVSRATLHDLYLRLMLRYMIFTGTWCYATRSSFAFAMDKSATSNSKKRLGGKGPLPEWHDQKRSNFLIFTKRIFDT